MAQMLSEQTGDGYVFRTDLRLRPDPSVTPVCLSMEAAERYYESVGRTWERAAYIKARPCAGDLVAGQGFLDRLTPFVWRKHLDYAAIEDAHDMRLRIREHKRLGGAITLPGHDMKLGRGGIREIEFFTQTRQIIAGGRDPSLRDRRTVEGLHALASKDWVPETLAQDLVADYRAHREVEHGLQMVADAQTHALPRSDDDFLRLARLSGREDVAAMQDEIRARLERVHLSTEPFFAPEEAKETAPADGFDDMVARWMRYPALRSDRARARFDRLRPVLFARLGAAAHPREALNEFDAFLSGLPAGVQLFALFEANPQLIDLIVDIAGTSPVLARYLGRNAQVLDAVIGGSFFSDWPGETSLRADLDRLLARASDYEAQLDTARRWMKEWHFRIGVHLLRGLADPGETAVQYGDLARVVLAGLLPVVQREFARKHGDAPGRGAAVIGMGSLGSGWLNAESDLDLIIVYDAKGVEASDGRRPLPARTYFARFTQALVTAMSAPMAEGRLYEIDMRLRPSGRQGPVATALESFRGYQMSEAWGWEHLALTRARAVAGDAGLCADIEAIRRTVLAEKGQGETVARDITEMRARLNTAKPRGSVWEVKDGPGGLRDIELFAQGAALIAGDPARTTLDQIAVAERIGWLTGDGADALRDAFGLMWRLLASQRLLLAGPFDPGDVGDGGQSLILRQSGAETVDALAAALQSTFNTVSGVIDAALADPVNGRDGHG